MQITTYFLRTLSACLLVTALAAPATAAPASDKDKAPPSAGSIDAATGKILTEAIGLINAENYNGAKAVIAKIKIETLSPYERSRTEQILASIANAQDDYTGARKHLLAAIEAGGLNETEISDMRYQIAQIHMMQEQWREGAAALEEWFKTAKTPNPAAYYLLAVAYYQQNDYNRALPPAEKAVAMTEKPQESWIQLVLALYLQKEQYSKAIPLLNKLIVLAPQTKTYWLQLSSIYGQTDNFPKSLAVMQLAYNGHILTEDSEIRRLADLQMFNEIPYRCATTLEDALNKKLVKADQKLYEKLSNCWVAAREFKKSISPLQRAADLSANGDLYARLGEVQVQLSDWSAATKSLQSALRKGGLKDSGNANLLLGIALFNQKSYPAAKDAFSRARNSGKHRKMADGYLQLIKAQSS